MKNLYFIALSVLTLLVGCQYGRMTASVNVQDYGEKVYTRYRYRVVSEERDLYGRFQRDRLREYQPDVFSDDGIPIVITNKTI